VKPVHWAAVASVPVLVILLLTNPGLFLLPADDLHQHSEGETRERWACPMLCVVLEHGGLCPVCGMDLEEIGVSEGAVTLSAAERELAGLSLVRAGMIRLRTRTVVPGSVTGAETSRSVITAWTSGRIDNFTGPATGETASSGATVAWIYSPELIEAQHDLLYALRRIPADTVLVAGARHRLRQLGASSWIIDRVASNGEVMESLPVVSRYSGTVLRRHVETGDWVSRGQVLLELSNFSDIWIEAELLEGQHALLNLHDSVLVMPYSGVESIPGEVIHIDPFYDDASRAATARIQAEGASAFLLPGQLVQIVLEKETGGSSEPDLAVPASAVLSLGERHLVYTLQSEDGTPPGSTRIPSAALGVSLEPRVVTVGPLSFSDTGERYYPVLSGLEEGEILAFQGAFLIDSQAELTGLPSLMKQMEP
jgi:membrane fusion protein, copper/silver efflux system